MVLEAEEKIKSRGVSHMGYTHYVNHNDGAVARTTGNGTTASSPSNKSASAADQSLLAQSIFSKATNNTLYTEHANASGTEECTFSPVASQRSRPGGVGPMSVPNNTRWSRNSNTNKHKYAIGTVSTTVTNDYSALAYLPDDAPEHLNTSISGKYTNPVTGHKPPEVELGDVCMYEQLRMYNIIPFHKPNDDGLISPSHTVAGATRDAYGHKVYPEIVANESHFLVPTANSMSRQNDKAPYLNLLTKDSKGEADKRINTDPLPNAELDALKVYNRPSRFEKNGYFGYRTSTVTTAAAGEALGEEGAAVPLEEQNRFNSKPGTTAATTAATAAAAVGVYAGVHPLAIPDKATRDRDQKPRVPAHKFAGPHGTHDAASLRLYYGMVREGEGEGAGAGAEEQKGKSGNNCDNSDDEEEEDGEKCVQHSNGQPPLLPPTVRQLEVVGVVLPENTSEAEITLFDFCRDTAAAASLPASAAASAQPSLPSTPPELEQTLRSATLLGLVPRALGQGQGHGEMDAQTYYMYAKSAAEEVILPPPPPGPPPPIGHEQEQGEGAGPEGQKRKEQEQGKRKHRGHLSKHFRRNSALAR